MLIYNLILFASVLIYVFTRDILPDHRAEIDIPLHALKELAEVFLPAILDMLSSEEGRKTLEQWKREYEDANEG